MVITIASHAIGRGFNPRIRYFSFLFLSISILVLRYFPSFEINLLAANCLFLSTNNNNCQTIKHPGFSYFTVCELSIRTTVRFPGPIIAAQ